MSFAFFFFIFDTFPGWYLCEAHWLTDIAVRTVKGIGILDAAPVYESLPGFTRYDIVSV